MVSTGTISSDKAQFLNLLNKYKSYTEEALASWEGDSANNFETITEEFIAEAKTVTNVFDNFFRAVTNYNYLLTAKRNVNTSYSNYSYYSQIEGEESNAEYWLGRYNTWSSNADAYKVKVEDYLAACNELIIEGGTGITKVSSANAVIQAAIDWAVAIANDDSHGYSQSTRFGNPNYDCSSFVTYAYQNAGTGCRDVGANVTSNMRSTMTQVGFEWIPYSYIDSGEVELEAGDILLDEDEHTEMYIGDGLKVGAHSNYDGVDGDSSGREISVNEYCRGTWDGVLRYTGNTDDDE